MNQTAWKFNDDRSKLIVEKDTKEVRLTREKLIELIDEAGIPFTESLSDLGKKLG